MNEPSLPGFAPLQEEWNKDVLEDLTPSAVSNLVVYSRDWTVDTIFSQIDQGNIDLNPQFQRRNAWNDEKRSRLIESLIIGIPIPEVVFAEDRLKKKAFIVIDGKQRLLTIAGFFQPDRFAYWNSPKLRGLQIRTDLNGISFTEISARSDFSEVKRQLLNSDIRCTVISNYSGDDVLYDIFHRLNTSSVPLSTQELRQALIKGDFGAYLMQLTETPQPLHEILGLDGPDARLRDVELILRHLAFVFWNIRYGGNLKMFLDEAMFEFNRAWPGNRGEIEGEYAVFNATLIKLVTVFTPRKVGRKMSGNSWEWRFNKALFEVEVFFFRQLPDLNFEAFRPKFLQAFEALCADGNFRDSIESTTKTVDQYRIRFTKFRDMLISVSGEQLRMPEFLA